MPIQLGRSDAEVVGGCETPRLSGLEPNDQDHQGPEGHVQAVKTSQGIEGAGVKVVGEAKGELEILHHLPAQKAQPHHGCEQEPAAAGAHGTAHQLFAGPVKGEAAGDQNRRVDHR